MINHEFSGIANLMGHLWTLMTYNEINHRFLGKIPIEYMINSDVDGTYDELEFPKQRVHTKGFLR